MFLIWAGLDGGKIVSGAKEDIKLAGHKLKKSELTAKCEMSILPIIYKHFLLAFYFFNFFIYIFFYMFWLTATFPVAVFGWHPLFVGSF